jgi:hypothetical protein
MKRIAAAALAAAILTTASAAGAAERLSIRAFFGVFAGGGVAENDDSIYFQTTARDFDVTIGPSADGFRIQWTTVLRRGGTPNKPEVRRNSTVKIMVATGRPGVYRCTDSGDPLESKQTLCWARIEGRTLSVFNMDIDEGGNYTLQQWDRTLSGAGMKLVFTSRRNGEELRIVSGHLVKTERVTPK